MQLSEITTENKEAKYRETLDGKSDVFNWALVDEVIEEMTKAIKMRDSNKSTHNKLYHLFRIHFIRVVRVWAELVGGGGGGWGTLHVLR